MNKYTTIVNWEYEGKTRTTLGNYDVLAMDLQHAEFTMDLCKVERVDVAVMIGEIGATDMEFLEPFDPRLN